VLLCATRASVVVAASTTLSTMARTVRPLPVRRALAAKVSAGETPSLAGVNEVGRSALDRTRVIRVGVVFLWVELDES
jgi:hypothetical protein